MLNNIGYLSVWESEVTGGKSQRRPGLHAESKFLARGKCKLVDALLLCNSSSLSLSFFLLLNQIIRIKWNLYLYLYLYTYAYAYKYMDA